jgi:hypothetical protein
MENSEASTRKSGYISKTTFYEAKNCVGCPLKCLCHNAKGNQKIEINHPLNEYRENARSLLHSHEGLHHRKQRYIEPESVFGQTKAKKQYYRFRHFGEDKIKMDFAIFAMAFNIGKMYNKARNASKIRKKSFFTLKNHYLLLLILITAAKNNPKTDFYNLNLIAV